MANVSGWSQEMDRKLDLIERDPEAYFDQVRDAGARDSRGPTDRILSSLKAYVKALLNHN